MGIMSKALGRLVPSIGKALNSVDNRGGWWPLIRESYGGAWQANVEVALEDALAYSTVFRCVSLIASDIAKMRLKLVEQNTATGIWSETTSPAFSPVLRKPNHYQTRIQFIQNWMESKLTRGNTYVLKGRDNRGVVVALYVLDPHRTRPLVADNGDVFYELRRDDLSGVGSEAVTIPASEIIHDRWNCLYHPLVGLSPIYACGINALTGSRITKSSAVLFANGARPSGVLSAPGAISDETAARLKAYWEENFSGTNTGKTAVLGDGLTYAPMAMSAVDTQLIEQLRFTDATIAGCFGVPAFMLNLGNAPSYNNVEALNQQYYSQALQTHIEAIEILLDEGLGLDVKTGERMLGTEFELDDLLRMDTSTLVKTMGEGVAKGMLKPNEGRLRLGYAPVDGGDTPYLQQQNYSLAALNKRDSQEDPFGTAPAPAPEPPADDPEPDPDESDDGVDAERALGVILLRSQKRKAA